MSYQYGGIWCTVHIGELYNAKVLHSARKTLRRLLLDGTRMDFRPLSPKELDNWIKQQLEQVTHVLIQQRKNGLFSQYHRRLTYMMTLRGNQANMKHRYSAAEREKMFNEANEYSKRIANLFNDSPRGAKFSSPEDNILTDISNHIGFVVTYRGKVYSNTVHNISGSVDAELSQFFSMHAKRLPIMGKGWGVIIAVSHPLAARMESKTAYPDKKYKGYNIRVLYDIAHDVANTLLSLLGHTSGKIRYGYILSRKGYEGKRLMLE